MKIFVPVLAMSALLASTVSGWSAAPSIEGRLEVRITIGQECKVNPNGNALLEFGSRSSLADGASVATAKEGAGAIQVRCSKDTPYTILLGAGNNPATTGDVNTRQMKSVNGDGRIAYQLYSDDGRTKIWGNTKSEGVAGKGTGELQSYQVFGSVNKAPETPAQGSYVDAVTVTVEF